MTFGSGGDLGSRPGTGSFDFGLTPSSQSTTGGDGASRGDRRRRRGPDRHVVGRVVVISALSLALIGAAGFAAWSMVQRSEAEVKADSAAFCADLATTPDVLTQPGFGWPTAEGTIPDTVAAMKAYQERWAAVAAIAPPTIRADVSAIATAAGSIAANVEASQSINRAGNLSAIESVTTQTVIPAWAAKYCD